MDTANALSLYIHDELREASKDEEGRRMKILKKAEMARVPSSSDVRRIMTVGVEVGVVIGALGVGLLMVANRRGESLTPEASNSGQ